MDIPDTPEELLANLGAMPLQRLFPNISELPVRARKLLRLIHQDLSSGDLTDQAFIEMTVLILIVWKSFNQSALSANIDRMEEEGEVDDLWIATNSHLIRMDQYLRSILAAVEQSPEPPTSDEDDESPYSSYVINPNYE